VWRNTTLPQRLREGQRGYSQRSIRPGPRLFAGGELIRKKSGELLKKLDNDYAAAAKGKGDVVFPKDLAEVVSRVTTRQKNPLEI
jgi:hypothetical protein